LAEFSKIVRNPEICGGEPTIKGTRVLVLDILELLKAGQSFDEILEDFPSITKEDIIETISYAEALISGEIIVYGSNKGSIST
jgi:uncharacterized protein (DUF433 family)